MQEDVLTRIASWRALPEEEKIRLRRDMVMEQMLTSMSMEGQPVSEPKEQELRQKMARKLEKAPLM